MHPTAAGDGQPEVRISDTDRQKVIDVLRTSCGEGRITLDEFAERAGGVYSARTRGELEVVLRDLPVVAPMPAAAPAPAPGTAPAPAHSPAHPNAHQTIVAVMSGQRRRGRWKVAESTTALAFWGGVDLDLRGAEISSTVVEITAIAIMGSVEIIVPEGIPVELDGFVLMGGSENRVRDATPLPGAPIIRVHAYGMWGGVVVRSKPLADPRAIERARHRDERRQVQRYGRTVPGGLPGPTAPAIPSLPIPPPPPPRPVRQQPQGEDIDAIVESLAHRPLDLRAQASPDGTLTILFTDIEGSAAWAERLGDHRWMQVLHDHNALVRGQVATFGGTEVKAQGDGFMVVFSSARRALLCAIGVQRSLESYRQEHPDSPVQVRIGVHTGEVIHEAGDFFGKNVILAARIATRARGGEILASSLVKELTDGADLGFDDGEEVELKGLARPYRLHLLAWR